MEKIYIVGAGGLGRKLFECIRRINNKKKRWEIMGFLDDNPSALKNVKCDLNIVGSMKDFIPSDDEVLALGISHPESKEKIVRMFKDKGAKFETIVSPEAIVGDYVEIGEGSVIMTPYNVESGAKVGEFVTILGSTIALDGEIGDYSTSTGFVNLTSSKIGKKVYIGTHSAILREVEVGDNSSISAGSIVYKNVPENVVVAGMPARVIKKK